MVPTTPWWTMEQLCLFKNPVEFQLEEMKRSMDKMRRSLFARINELEMQVLSLEKKLDKKKKEKPKPVIEPFDWQSAYSNPIFG